MFDRIAQIYALDDDVNHDCTQNIFDGSWASANAVNYFITRSIQSFSAIYICLYLYYKKKANTNPFKSRNSSSHSGLYGSDANEILYNYNQMMRENIDLTPDASDGESEQETENERAESFDEQEIMERLRKMQQDSITKFKLIKKETKDILDENLEDNISGRNTIKRPSLLFNENYAIRRKTTAFISP